MTIVGQRLPRRREGGVWVEVAEETGLGPQGNTVEEDDEAANAEEAAAEEAAEEAEQADEENVEEQAAEEQAAEEQAAEEADDEAGTELNKLSRAELDAYAREQGLDPSQYRNRELLLEALE